MTEKENAFESLGFLRGFILKCNGTIPVDVDEACATLGMFISKSSLKQVVISTPQEMRVENSWKSPTDCI